LTDPRTAGIRDLLKHLAIYEATDPTLEDGEAHNLILTSNGRLLVHIEHVDYEPHYVELPHGVNTAVWTPTSGSHLHITGGVISVESAGLVELFYDTTLFMKLHFNEKRAVPISILGELTFATDKALKATFTADVADGSAYITAIGHEHV